MLCLNTSPLFLTPLSHTFSTVKHTPKLPKLAKRNSRSFSTINMSSTIEHIVLLKFKPDTDQSKITTTINNLNGLISLDPVLHLTAGALLRTKSSSFNFTHMLHSRYSSKENLNAYSTHPNHMRVAKENVLPICEDIMAVDWVVDDLNGSVSLSPGAAVRVTFLKLKENVDEGVKSEVLRVIEGLREKFGGIVQLSCGENFSPARAKGFSIASLAVFNGVSELDAVVENELVGLEKDKVREYLESILVVDYVVPSAVAAQPASL